MIVSTGTSGKEPQSGGSAPERVDAVPYKSIRFNFFVYGTASFPSRSCDFEVLPCQPTNE